MPTSTINLDSLLSRPDGTALIRALIGEPSYETKLPPIKEMQYQKWRKSLPRGLQYEGDYDLRGAYLDNIQVGVGNDGTPHFDDKFKKPNHPKFSRESIYASPTDPTWMRTENSNRLIDALGNLLLEEFDPEE